MTEAEWLTSVDADPMLGSLQGDLSERKLRLFACACCHHVGWLLLDDRSWDAIIVAERHAEGLATDEELELASATAVETLQQAPQWPGDPERLAASAVWSATAPVSEGTIFEGEKVAGFAVNTAIQAAEATPQPKHERSHQAILLRCIFGNPFRPVAFSPSWRTDTAFALARQMYESRDFGAMPILADALQDSGCDNDDILSHCRDVNGVHVRGCWVVDLVLGKE